MLLFQATIHIEPDEIGLPNGEEEQVEGSFEMLSFDSQANLAVALLLTGTAFWLEHSVGCAGMAASNELGLSVHF